MDFPLQWHFQCLGRALFVLAFMTALAGLVAHVPISALAGVTAWMGFCLLEWSTWSRLNKMRRTDAAAFLLTALSVLVVNAAVAVKFFRGGNDFPLYKLAMWMQPALMAGVAALVLVAARMTSSACMPVSRRSCSSRMLEKPGVAQM